MIIRRAEDRGRTEAGWLHSRHTFSFGGYHDPAHMGLRSLRVINDDVVEPGGGFGTHGHRDMEIISIVLEGALEHRDSLGHGGVLRPGEVQVMTAGRGIRHSEFNASATEPVHFLQVWIVPEQAGLDAAYAQRAFSRDGRLGVLRRVAGRDAVERDGALKINQDADLFLAAIGPGGRLAHAARPGRALWVHVATGSAEVNGSALGPGDAAAFPAGGELALVGRSGPADLLVFDLG